MRHRRQWKQAGIMFLAAVVLGSGAMSLGAGRITSLAAGGSVTPLSQYDEETMNLFRDDVLEYWEIPGLIEHYNPNYLNKLENFYYNPDGSTGLSKDQLINMATQLRSEAADLQDELDEKVDSGELKKNGEGYQDYKDNIKTLKRYARELEDASKGSASTKRVLRIAKNELTVKLSAQMREYQKLVSQLEIQKKNLEISQLTYEAAKRQADLGMYSAAQVRAAELAWNAAQAKTDAAAAETSKIKADLISALGWHYEANPEICQIPEPEIEKITGYDLAVDMETAINNNYDIVDIRRTDASEYGGAVKKRKEIETQTTSVKIQLEVLYKNVLSMKETYDGAQSGWSSAEQKKAQADRKYALGMISRGEYLQEEVSWLTAKASREQASLNLLEAMETYEWAVKGLME